MKNKKTKKTLKLVVISGAILVVAIFAAFFIYSAKLYPAAIVNGKYISIGNYNAAVSASNTYFTRLLEANKTDVSEENKQAFLKETKRNVLQALIEQGLIRQYLESSMKGEELRSIIKNKISDALADTANIENGIADLYGLEMEDFTNLILVPKAEREIIEGKFVLDGKDFSVWFKEAKNNAKVSILISGIIWKDGKAEYK